MSCNSPKLKDFRCEIGLLQEVSSSITASAGWWDEYYWEINLDNGRFIASQPACSVSFKVAWTIKSLHRLLNQPGDYAYYLDMWLCDMNSYSPEGSKDDSGQYSSILINEDFKIASAVLLIQTQYRRFRKLKEALEPPLGVLFLLAQKRFLQTSSSAAATLCF